MKVRCKRCGESFPVDSSKQSGEVYARPSATSHATPLTGERNEASVLFSLAALSRHAPAPQAPKVTESSALIDIRALVLTTSKGKASAPRADDIVNLSGGGAFAPLFAPPVTFVPAQNEEPARRGKGPLVTGAMALAFVAMVSVAAFASVRSRSSASPTRVSAPAEVPSALGPAPSNTLATTANEAPPASETRVAAVTPVRTGTTSNVAPPARTAARSNASRSVAAQAATVSAVSTPSAAPKCCPGESELACHMRIAAGAACSR